MISFIKAYPVYPYINEDQEVITKKGELSIFHTGILDMGGMCMYGHWSVDMDEENPPEGIWWLKKIS
ncbi:hypothetical protein [Nonlabens xiamenensis]|uniref:hypothetical protein n=1 Tax=Nonlabens xiamenensis TaxID=2341043 RepID=UPI000F60DDC5|nr:hypothetical protein [Nonlabens xiamenensis]